jgi:DNA polymerase bacteriophage-type
VPSTLEVLNPVFIDLETRSCCDLPEVGGWNYAAHPTTRLLTVSWSSEPDVFHLWLPGVESDRVIPADYAATHLGDCVVHLGPDLPLELAELAESDRPWVAHNAWTFDAPVWKALIPTEDQPSCWLDTYPLALACGMPGGLNEISKRLWGEGKYEQGSKALKDASRCQDPDIADACNVPLAIQILVGRYNVQDVRLLRWLWDELARSLDMPQSEIDVLHAHRAVNDRGVRIDVKLLRNLITLSDECKTHAIQTITELTDGFLASLTDLNSRNRVFKWLDSQGINLGCSLRREIVQRFVEDNAEQADEEAQADETSGVSAKTLQKVLKVLELRTCALRVTDGKLKAALQSLSIVDTDWYVVRGMFVYWGAHTGRWTARRIQLHNLPKPKDGINKIKGGGVWALFDLHDRSQLDFDHVAALLDPTQRFLTPDDAVSAMMRSIIVPDPGCTLATADLSQIECRVLAWLAEETWLLDSFWTGKVDPYIRLAEKICGSWWNWPGIKQHVTFRDTGEAIYDKAKVAGLLKKHDYRQLGKIGELGLGYSLGIDGFALYAASSGCDLEELNTTPQIVVEAYRDSHPAIAGHLAGEYNGRKYYRDGYWHKIEAAAVHCCKTNEPVTVGRITFLREAGNLICLLPSGRRLVYRSARVERGTKFGKEADILYYTSPRFGKISTYGGKLVENIVQAVSRDVIAASIVRVEQDGMPVCLHVHDEIGASVHESQVPRFMELVSTCPDWLTGFPLACEGGGASRYAKSPPPGVKEATYRNGRPM